MATHPQSFNYWYDRFLNRYPLMLDDSKIHTFGVAWIFREDNSWKLLPRITGDHQYYNAQFFIRLGIPFAIFFGMRLSATRLFQIGIGWKQNGRFAIHFRLQTDASAAAGTHSPNYNQSTGWNYGEH